MPPRVLAVLGPTASGKSALSLSLAAALDGEIINCDSTAVYRGFDIGTDKLSISERQGIPHHLIDIADPIEVYTAARFTEDAERAIRDIHRRLFLSLRSNRQDQSVQSDCDRRPQCNADGYLFRARWQYRQHYRTI